MKSSSIFAMALDQQLLKQHLPLLEYLQQLGDTPLMEVPGADNGSRVFAKCEWTNPTGTVKDRPVFGMVYRELKKTPLARRGEIHILEYTGGSLGLALSRLCARLGLRLTLVLSAATDPALVAELSGHGSEVVLVDRERGFWGVMEMARRLAAENPTWRFLYQHENPANLWMHRYTTGQEIAEQLPNDAVDGPCAWLASIGTGGTLMGVYAALVPKLPQLQLFATTPAELPYGSNAPPNGKPKFLGSGGLGCGRKQPFVASDESRIKGHMQYSYDEALRGMRDFHALTGLKIGSSAAANWLAARQVAERLGPKATVITVFPSAATDFEWNKAGVIATDENS
jgi:cysteine synthase A